MQWLPGPTPMTNNAVTNRLLRKHRSEVKLYHDVQHVYWKPKACADKDRGSWTLFPLQETFFLNSLHLHKENAHPHSAFGE